MIKRSGAISTILFALILVVVSSLEVTAKPNAFDAISDHLRTRYGAKKVHVPFVFLARMAVHIAKPAGVKSFNVTIFRDLRIRRETLDAEMQQAMRNSFGPEWSSVLHLRSRVGEQAYAYMREDGENVRVAIVTIENDKAILIRATFSPEKLSEFITAPQIFGIRLDDTPDQLPSRG